MKILKYVCLLLDEQSEQMWLTYSVEKYLYQIITVRVHALKVFYDFGTIPVDSP